MSISAGSNCKLCGYIHFGAGWVCGGCLPEALQLVIPQEAVEDRTEEEPVENQDEDSSDDGAGAGVEMENQGSGDIIAAASSALRNILECPVCLNTMIQVVFLSIIYNIL